METLPMSFEREPLVNDHFEMIWSDDHVLTILRNRITIFSATVPLRESVASVLRRYGAPSDVIAHMVADDPFRSYSLAWRSE
jgi:hypothetical protein